jgi:hypothetical protein
MEGSLPVFKQATSSRNVLGADFNTGAAGSYLSPRTYKYLFVFLGLQYVNNDRWVEAWFFKDTWVRMDEVMDNNLLRLPKSACLSGPVCWIANRLVRRSILAVIYMNRQAVWPEAAVGKIDSPPEGVSLEEWFAEVRMREKELALALGFDNKVFSGAKVTYK